MKMVESQCNVGFTPCHEPAPKSPGGIQTFPTFTPLLLGRVARNLCDGLVLGDRMRIESTKIERNL